MAVSTDVAAGTARLFADIAYVTAKVPALNVLILHWSPDALFLSNQAKLRRSVA